jgi:hypothetical protein
MCRPMPPPFALVMQLGFVMLQAKDGSITMLYDQGANVRRIRMNAAHPAKVVPSPMGDSVGHWEGDTLVVDTVGFNEESWLDNIGHPHTEMLHITERLHRVDLGHLEIEFTIEDPGTYSKPWVIKRVADLCELDERIAPGFGRPRVGDATRGGIYRRESDLDQRFHRHQGVTVRLLLDFSVQYRVEVPEILGLLKLEAVAPKSDLRLQRWVPRTETARGRVDPDGRGLAGRGPGGPRDPETRDPETRQAPTIRAPKLRLHCDFRIE